VPRKNKDPDLAAGRLTGKRAAAPCAGVSARSEYRASRLGIVPSMETELEAEPPSTPPASPVPLDPAPAPTDDEVVRIIGAEPPAEDVTYTPPRTWRPGREERQELQGCYDDDPAPGTDRRPTLRDVVSGVWRYGRANPGLSAVVALALLVVLAFLLYGYLDGDAGAPREASAGTEAALHRHPAVVRKFAVDEPEPTPKRPVTEPELPPNVIRAPRYGEGPSETPVEPEPPRRFDPAVRRLAMAQTGDSSTAPPARTDEASEDRDDRTVREFIPPSPPPAKPKPKPEPAAPDPKPGFMVCPEGLRLTGIVRMPRGLMADINGKFVGEGDRVKLRAKPAAPAPSETLEDRWAKVVRISRTSVEMELNGKRFTLGFGTNADETKPEPEEPAGEVETPDEADGPAEP